MATWKPSESKKLRGLYDKKPAWETDYQFAAKVSKMLGKSPESIRWQVRQYKRVAEVTFPKILLLDIETIFIEASVWGVRKQFIQPGQIRKDWSILCWSAKWLFGKEHFGETVTPEEAINHTDVSVLGGIWKLMDEADVIITYNGDYFDLKKLNTRFLLFGYPPPSYYKSIDVYKHVTENFSFTYGKLDVVAELLGVGRKIQTSFVWWDECSKGNKVYLEKMLKYNMCDVDLLEEVYFKIRPWIKNHPNLNLFSVGNIVACPNCACSELKWEYKYQTPLALYQAFRCQKCGAIGRSTRKQYKLSASKARS